jgi:hypothetical protein
MTAAEKQHGFISRAEDRDPWLARVREAVAHEAASYGSAYPEGQGTGLRYTAFDRHAGDRAPDARAAQGRQADLRARAHEPQAARAERAAAAHVPRRVGRRALARREGHASRRGRGAALPAYSDYVDRAASGQKT